MSKSTDAPRAKSERSAESAKALLRVASSLDKHSHHGCPDRAEKMHRKHLLGGTFGRGICGTVAAIVPLYLLTRVVSVAWGAVWLSASGTALVVPLKSDSNASQEVQRASAQLPSGIVVANVSWAVDEETGCDVLRGYIEFRPDADKRSSCSSIRFIQVAKTEQSHGLDYDWQGREQARNLLRTSSQMGAGIQGGYFVDHKASACTPAVPCSPYFRDHWANPLESRDGFQATWGAAPASLVDYPFGWDVLGRITLESCARCIETGEFLGCAEWGARWPLFGARSISPIRIRQAPSQTFLAALHVFEQFYVLKSPVEATR